jgi:iron complex transport system ATP-binding protein
MPNRDTRGASGGPEPLLELQDATVIKGADRRVLDGLSLKISAGEHTAIIGPNGSGKSSLIKLIAYQHYPLARRTGPPVLRVFGRERWNVFELRRHMGIVSGELHQAFIGGDGYGRSQGLEAVASGFFASQSLFDHQEIDDAMWEQAYAALDLMEATHLAEKPIAEMSTGEARRTLIARALVTDPRALLLDEPTTGLDLAAQQRFLQTLRKVAAAGKTIILITHHIEEIIPEIERVILLQAGRIFRDGPKTGLLTGELLSELFGAPIAVEAAANGFYRARSALQSMQKPGDFTWD